MSMEMPAATVQIIDGKAVARAVEGELRVAMLERVAAGLRRPHLAAVLVGANPASEIYVGHKVRACERVGFHSTLIRLPEDVRPEVLLAELDALNADPDIHGILVQLPLPNAVDAAQVIERIDPRKDVDGFHPMNMGRLASGLPGLRPATPRGIIELLQRSGIETAGKRVVILGRSSIVGTPLALLLSRNAVMGNATVTLCHSQTPDAREISREADILVAAMGRLRRVGADWVKPGATVIDVGIHALPNVEGGGSGRRIAGDVDFEAVAQVAGALTPVPGGVGPMTIAALLMNTLQAAEEGDGGGERGTWS
jgi:methylenetetrahydrofolate dehydrogenase (NADP+)/methenyltetrahydrofolate cyclohydrolase